MMNAVCDIDKRYELRILETNGVRLRIRSRISLIKYSLAKTGEAEANVQLR